MKKAIKALKRARELVRAGWRQGMKDDDLAAQLLADYYEPTCAKWELWSAMRIGIEMAHGERSTMADRLNTYHDVFNMVGDVIEWAYGDPDNQRWLSPGGYIIWFNNVEGRTKDQVIYVLDVAIERLEAKNEDQNV